MNNIMDNSLCVRQEYNYNRQRVFNAFATAESLDHWFSPHADIKTKVTDFEFRVGGQYRIEFFLPNKTKTSLRGEYQSIDRPNQLSFTWCWEEPDPHAGIDTLVTIDFIDKGTTTELVVSHIKLDGPGMKDRHSAGWSGTLHRLQTWLEQTTTKTT